MSQLAAKTNAASSTGKMEKQIREFLDSLSYLPTTTAVALKFVEGSGQRFWH